MSTRAAAPPSPIALPLWYAAFSREPGAPLAPTRDGAGQRLGPLTIFRAIAGCDIATFGDPADPGVVLVDGYLFDRSATTRDLDLAPGAGDAAIASAAYQRWGLELFDRLDGSYLVAIWDPRDRRLLIGHDPLGHHPVFYAERSDALWFSSNVLALPRSGAVPSQPNRISLALSALQSWPASGQTFFEHVRRLKPGSYLVAPGGAPAREQPYWSPWLDDDDPGLSEQQALEQFEPVLAAAIGRCMELVPEGVMLSGGLDSVAIAALAADYSSARGAAPLRAVSGRRDRPSTTLDPLADEEPMQSAVARALRMDHLVAYEAEWTGPRPSVALSLDAVSELPGPSRISWVGAYMAFYRFVAAHGVHVALTGSGGDNWVSVGDAFAAHAMQRLRLHDLVLHMRSWMGTGGLTFRNAAQHLLWSAGLRLILDSHAARWAPGLKARYHRRRAVAALPEWLCPDPGLRDQLTATLSGQRPAALTRSGRIPRNFYRHAQRATVNPYFQYEFEVGFHVESACGLRLLSPYHDRTVVRFLNSIPPRVLLQGGSYKGMLRPIAQRRLPDLGLDKQRKTHGEGIVRSHLQELRDGMIGAWSEQPLTRLEELGVIDRAGVEKTLRLTGESGDDHLLPAYALASAERWLEAHVPRR